MGTRTALFSRRQAGGVFTIYDFEKHPATFSSSTAGRHEWRRLRPEPDAPLATVDYAVGLCEASKGDVIYALPGHAETLDAATDFVLDVIGVSIIGLGRGSLRPTFTFGATDAIISVTAANCLIKNILCVGNIDDIVTGSPSAPTRTASSCSMPKCATGGQQGNS